MGRVLQDTRLRTAPGRRSAWVAKVALQEEVRIVREERGWYWVEQETGEAGYIAKEDVALAGIRSRIRHRQRSISPGTLGRPIVLTWEYVGTCYGESGADWGTTGGRGSFSNLV